MTNTFSSWSHSLEDLVCDYTSRSFSRRRSLGFTPQKARNPAAYDRVPSVLVVASAATRHLHRAFFESLELLEKASGAFKVAVFAEAGSEDIIKGFDWAVEHVFSEGAWWGMSNRNWLEMAYGRLEWAQQMYGASCVVAARSVIEANAEISRLGTYFGLDRLAVSAAQTHMERTVPAESESTHSWVRGWIHELPQGISEHTFNSEPLDGCTASVRKTDNAIALLMRPGEHSSLRDEAQKRGWNIVTISWNAGNRASVAELALGRALVSGFGAGASVFEVLNQSISSGDSQFAAGTVIYCPERKIWCLGGLPGLRVERGDVAGICGALESVSRANALTWPG